MLRKVLNLCEGDADGGGEAPFVTYFTISWPNSALRKMENNFPWLSYFVCTKHSEHNTFLTN